MNIKFSVKKFAMITNINNRMAFRCLPSSWPRIHDRYGWVMVPYGDVILTNNPFIIPETKDPATLTSRLKSLFNTENWRTRRAIVCNPSLPIRFLLKVSISDRSKRVRHTATQMIAFRQKNTT